MLICMAEKEAEDETSSGDTSKERSRFGTATVRKHRKKSSD